MYTGEATIDVSWEDSWQLLESSLKGRFWKRGPGNMPEIPEVLCNSTKASQRISNIKVVNSKEPSMAEWRSFCL